MQRNTGDGLQGLSPTQRCTGTKKEHAVPTRRGVIPPSIRGMHPNRRGSQKVGQCKWLAQGTLPPPRGGNSFSRAAAVLLLLSRWCIYFKCFRSLEVGKLRQRCHLLLSDSSTSCDLHWGVQIDLPSLPFGSDESCDTDVSQPPVVPWTILGLSTWMFSTFDEEYHTVFVWQVVPTSKWNEREWRQIDLFSESDNHVCNVCAVVFALRTGNEREKGAYFRIFTAQSIKINQNNIFRIHWSVPGSTCTCISFLCRLTF